MKSLIIESTQEIAQNPKTALMVTTAAAANGAVLTWVETNIGWISGVVGLVGAIIVTVIQIVRVLMEKKEHELNVKLKEKELNE